MALSNWDTLAIDETGKSADGSFSSPLGVRCRIYKNWLYVEDDAAWQGGTFTKPTIMDVQHGELRYRDVSIVSVRGPQDGIFAIISTGHCEKIKVMAGCGVYGYDGDEWSGVSKEAVEFLKSLIEKDENIKYQKGILKAMLDGFENPKRFNQGDAYFADKIGFEVPTSNPGEAAKSILSNILEKQ